MNELFSDYAIQRVTSIICGIRDKLCLNEAIKDAHGAKAAVIDICNRAKDEIQKPWTERTAKHQDRGIS